METGLKSHGRAGVNGSMRIATLVLVGLPLVSGCVSLPEAASRRASLELACPKSQLTIVNRAEIDAHLFDVAGCGRLARYMCVQPYRSDTYCVREPTPKTAEPAVRHNLDTAEPTVQEAAAPPRLGPGSPRRSGPVTESGSSSTTQP